MATTSISTFRGCIDGILQIDDAELSDAIKNERIKAALERYSVDVPRSDQVDDVSGDGGKFYPVAASLSSWAEGFSRITRIELPAATIASDESPVFLDNDDWFDDYWADASGTQTRYLFLPSHSPAATDTMRISYLIPYTFTGDPENTDTPTQDFYALCQLAAGLACQALAVKYAQIGDSTIAADSVDHAAKSDTYSERSAELIKLYERHFGLGEDAANVVTAGGAFADWDTEPALFPDPWLFHGER